MHKAVLVIMGDVGNLMGMLQLLVRTKRVRLVMHMVVATGYNEIAVELHH